MTRDLIDYAQKLKPLTEAFAASNREIRFVGGCVRDWLNGDMCKDVDLCTNATPEEMIAIAAMHGFRIIPTGIDHGTMTFVVNDDTYEVTTLRIDVETDGRHAVVKFTDNWREDLARRDLTINAISMDMEGRIFDPFRGAEDLKDRKIRFVGDARTRVREDYLRILRYFRFYARYAKNTDKDWDTYRVIRDEAIGLNQISVERIWSEMQKILNEPRNYHALDGMYFTNVLYYIGLGYVVPQVLPSGNAVTKLAALAGKSFDPLTWKMSSAEVAQYKFLTTTDVENVMQAKRAVIMRNVPKHFVTERLYMINATREMHDEFGNWIPPVFPVTGHDMIEAGFQTGPAMGVALNTMKQMWADSEYTLTKNDLMEAIAKF